jgi:hypothetical protein
MSQEEIVSLAKEMLLEGKRKTEIAKEIASDLQVNKNSIYTLIKDI